jgi:hypothetical protein
VIAAIAHYGDQSVTEQYKEKRMSTQEAPLTYEGILKMIRGIARQQKKTERMIQELVAANKEATEERKKMRTDIGKWDDRIGRIIEYMIGEDNILEQFQALGYDITTCYRDKKFGPKGTSESGQVDLILEDGDDVILIEVKTTLRTEDILDHIDKIEKFRKDADARGKYPNQRFLGAVAGMIVADNVAKFALSKGMYVIAQTGETFEIIKPPEGFTATKW